jgi:hypothetical protein
MAGIVGFLSFRALLKISAENDNQLNGTSYFRNIGDITQGEST